jgi:DNA-binding transcriptional MocR family regulator
LLEQVKSREYTRTGDVMAAIRLKISSRALASGDRLPSIRSFAATMGVSPSTVVEAYDRLAAEGLIRPARFGLLCCEYRLAADGDCRGRAATRSGR